MKEIVMRLMISNMVALLVFYLMYRFGVTSNIPYVRDYYLIPLAILAAYLIRDDYKELKYFSTKNA